jgi:hypothetical protein
MKISKARQGKADRKCYARHTKAGQGSAGHSRYARIDNALNVR